MLCCCAGFCGGDLLTDRPVLHVRVSGCHHALLWQQFAAGSCGHGLIHTTQWSVHAHHLSQFTVCSHWLIYELFKALFMKHPWSFFLINKFTDRSILNQLSGLYCKSIRSPLETWNILKCLNLPLTLVLRYYGLVSLMGFCIANNTLALDLGARTSAHNTFSRSHGYHFPGVAFVAPVTISVCFWKLVLKFWVR